MVGPTTKVTVDNLHHHHQQQRHHNLMEDHDGVNDHQHSYDVGDDDGVEHRACGVSCSICLDLVSDNVGRSRAKLQCGHEFHLDCIGSAFNVKGAMQCPNCRNVEKGQWLFANGSTRSLQELSMEDWIPDADFYNLSYEMPYRVHWCPFDELARVGSSFEEVESPSTTHHDARAHHSIYGEHTGASSVAHSYVAYVGPIPPASSRSNDSVDDPNFNHHWNGLPGHNEIFNPNTFPTIDIQYHSWGLHSPPFSVSSSHINSADPASLPPLTLRSSNGESDTGMRSTSFPHPILFGHGPGPTAGGSFVSSIVPHHPGNSAQTLERFPISALERFPISHAFRHRQQSSNSPVMPSPTIHGIRRFDAPRGLPMVVPALPHHDHGGGFFIIPPSSSPGQSLHEAESPLPNRFHAWEREHLSRFQHGSVNRDMGWASFHQNAGASDSGNMSSSFWRRHSA